MNPSFRNRFKVSIDKNAAPLFVRTGSFLRHPDAKLVVPYKGRMIFSRLSKQLYFLFRVEEGEFELTTPFPDAYITEINLRDDEIFIIKLDHVLAFEETMFFDRKWKVDLTSMLTSQLRYVYFRGPGRLIFFGLGEIGVEEVQDTSADYDQGSVVGWSNDLAVGVGSRSTVLSAFFNKEDICLDRFSGNGKVVTQASIVKRLPKRFHDAQSNTSIIEYINALVGLRM